MCSREGSEALNKKNGSSMSRRGMYKGGGHNREAQAEGRQGKQAGSRAKRRHGAAAGGAGMESSWAAAAAAEGGIH